MNSRSRISWSVSPSALNPKATQRNPSPAGCGFDGCESAVRTIAKACLFVPASGADLAIVERLAEAALRAREKDPFKQIFNWNDTILPLAAHE